MNDVVTQPAPVAVDPAMLQTMMAAFASLAQTAIPNGVAAPNSMQAEYERELAFAAMDKDNPLDGQIYQEETNPNVTAEFFPYPILDRSRSGTAQGAIYKDIVGIKIFAIGENGRAPVVERIAEPQDFVRFRKAWEARKAQRDAVGDGFPIKRWDAATPSLIKNLEKIGIHTLEQFVTYARGRSGLTREMVEAFQKAEAFLTSSGLGNPVVRDLLEQQDTMKFELESAQVETANLRNMVEKLLAEKQEAETKSKKKD